MIKISFIICMVALFISCSDSAANFDWETFERERRLWLEQDIQNYSFGLLYTTKPHVDLPKIIYVQNETLKYFRFDLDGSGITYPSGTRGVFLIPKDSMRSVRFGDHYYLFRSISEINEDIEMQANLGKRIEVRYNSELHYPAYASCVGSDNFWHYIERLDNFVIDPDLSDETVGTPEVWPKWDGATRSSLNGYGRNSGLGKWRVQSMFWQKISQE